MIIILSKSELDFTTEVVLDWVLFFNAKYRRINGGEEIDFNQDFSEYTSVWFRSWIAEHESFNNILADSIENTIKLDKNLRNENKVKSEYLFHKLRDKYWLTHPEKMSVNKLVILDEAKQLGLNTPETVVLISKKELLEFKAKHNRIITKSMANPLPFVSSTYTSILYTKEVSDQVIHDLPDSFPTSLFQRLIVSKFEIRVFVINNKTFSTAIFNSSTKGNGVDYRSAGRNIRQVPFQLPLEIERKLIMLLGKLEFNTASIDLIYGEDNLFYFLEVNPIGQFSTVSEAGNYYLEREVAMNLIQNSERNN